MRLLSFGMFFFLLLLRQGHFASIHFSCMRSFLFLFFSVVFNVEIESFWDAVMTRDQMKTKKKKNWPIVDSSVVACDALGRQSPPSTSHSPWIMLWFIRTGTTNGKTCNSRCQLQSIFFSRFNLFCTHMVTLASASAAGVIQWNAEIEAKTCMCHFNSSYFYGKLSHSPTTDFTGWRQVPLTIYTASETTPHSMKMIRRLTCIRATLLNWMNIIEICISKTGKTSSQSINSIQS